MATPTDQLSPETLEKYFSSGTVTIHPVNDSPEAMIIIDGPGEKISVLAAGDGMVNDTAPLRRVTTNTEVHNGVEWTRVTLDARGIHAEAYGLAISIVQAMRGGATFAAASSAALTNMKALLAAKPRISEEKQVGLVGELLLLRTLLDSYPESPVFEWWLGPLAEERDFAFPAFDAEVKTTLSEARTHVIHGVGQLEPSPGRSLWLVSIQLTRAGGNPEGRSLPQLVGEVRDRLGIARSQFVNHLASQGWDDADAAMYPTTYVLRNTPAAYLVDDDFPAVTPQRLQSMVPHSNLVSDVTYRVNVSGRTTGSPGVPLDVFIAPSVAQEA